MSGFEHLLTDTISVAPYLGRDGSTDPMYGPVTTMSARVEERTSEIRDPDGKTRRATHSIATALPIKLTDRVWVAGKDTSKPGESLTPVRVRKSTNPSGTVTLYRTDLG